MLQATILNELIINWLTAGANCCSFIEIIAQLFRTIFFRLASIVHVYAMRRGKTGFQNLFART